ncbi:flagellin [Anoxybacillus flavithermus]|uniref:flagellin N-terminal helical domain-containing protein n=1 Tax=Anoxybacillus flavithermus TaxID=33934 RepID=UPI000ACDE878|nr:flagellin [Anoxybacillus flavithermus]MBE2941401.1 flagellin [Anoxybacillus flavithermus]MBE2944031.1 flagellin [Anoxybacillus flavithermus]MBE2952319.1 flagellin [Anoxybacillus flavithermus]MBE2954948.1 flagellin [Anoxybacillus flavithermus]MBE2960340.1 flagellin [Anoxybacillus flavithermus]
MRINHNIAALNTYRQLTAGQSAATKNMEKLSSGLRINKAGDDAAGLAISEKMRGQIRGLEQAGRNAQDGISLIQTAEGALNETHAILQRMRELAVQAANDTNTTTDRGEIQKEINQLTSEINRIGNTTEFNTQKLLDGTKAGSSTATAAKVTGSTVTLGSGTNFSGANLVFTVGIGTTTKTVTLNQNYDGSTKTMTDLVNDLQTALGSGVTVTNNSGKIEITAKNTTDSITINAATSGNLSAIGLTAGTTNPTPATDGLTFQIGANGGQSIGINISDMRATSTLLKVATATGTTVTASSGKVATYTTATDVTDGTTSTGQFKALDVSTNANATAAIDVIDDAIKNVSAERSKLGAYQNRLEHTINNLGTAAENLTAAESRIRDVDYALAA